MIVTQQVDEAVLDRVEVLGLVDEQVPEAPPSRRREVAVVLQRFDGEAEHVVEVDHAAPPLVVAVVGEAGGDAGRLPSGGLSPGTSRLARVRLGRDGPRRRPVDLGDRSSSSAATVRRSRARGGAGRRRASAAGRLRSAQRWRNSREHHRVERAGLDPLAEPEPGQPAAQLARRLARERERQRVAGVGGAGHDAVGDPPGEHSGLAGTGSGDDRDQPRVGGDGVALFGVQIVEQRRGVHPAQR